MNIAVLETLLNTWGEHSGSRDPAYAALDREFRSALGPDFEISSFQSLNAARAVEAQYINKHAFTKDKDVRKKFKRRQLLALRADWNATQTIPLRDQQLMLDFQSLALQ